MAGLPPQNGYLLSAMVALSRHVHPCGHATAFWIRAVLPDPPGRAPALPGTGGDGDTLTRGGLIPGGLAGIAAIGAGDPDGGAAGVGVVVAGSIPGVTVITVVAFDGRSGGLT
jgi:hypothetical protein